MHFGEINDRLDDAVAIDGRYIYGSTGSALIKYAWPGMVELERHDLGEPITQVTLWTHKVVVVVTESNVWTCLVDAPLSSAKVMYSGDLAAVSSFDTLLYIARKDGVVLRSDGSNITEVVNLDRSISWIAGTSRYLVTNSRADEYLLVVDLRSGKWKTLTKGKPGRSVVSLNDSTFAHLVASEIRIFMIRGSLFEYTPIRNAYIIDHTWQPQTRLLALSSTVLMNTCRSDDRNIISSIASGYDYWFVPFYSLGNVAARVSDSTIAIPARAHRQNFDLVPEDSLTYASLIEFDIRDGKGLRGYRLPTAAPNILETQCFDTSCIVTRHVGYPRYFPSSHLITPTSNDARPFGSIVRLTTRDSLAWVVYAGNYSSSLDSLWFSDDWGRSWDRTIPSRNQYSIYATPMYQVGGDGRFISAHYSWKNSQLIQAKGSALWLSGSIVPPIDDLIPEVLLQTGDNKVLVMHSRKSSPDLPCFIWEADYNTYTERSTLLNVPDYGPSALIAARRYNDQIMGLWRTPDRNNYGTFVTDGTRWNYQLIEKDLVNDDMAKTMVAVNNNTLVLLDKPNRELILFHPTLDPTVSVGGDASITESPDSPIGISTDDGIIAWDHGLASALVRILDVRGQCVASVLANNLRFDTQLTSRGVYLLVAESGREIRRLRVLY